MKIELTKKQILALLILTNNQEHVLKTLKENYGLFSDEKIPSLTELSNSLSYSNFWKKMRKNWRFKHDK